MDSVLLTTPEPTLGRVLGHAMTIVDGTVPYFGSKCDFEREDFVTRTNVANHPFRFSTNSTRLVGAGC